MAKKLVKILERNDNCVLLQDKRYGHYKVMDIENYCIAMGSYENCKMAFDEYDINRVREERRKQLEDWLEEYAEA